MPTDSDLRRDVEAELESDPSIDASEIGVAVSDGVATLTGRVRSYWEKWSVERIVERVAGVRGVANDLEVHLGTERTDTDIAKAAADALEWSISVPRNQVTAKVEDGWITLKGEVSYEYQRRAAERAVRSLTGVKGVTNLIRIKPRVQPRDVKERIESSFERQAILDAKRISVQVSGGEVTLRGRVRSWSERHEAEKAAWRAPGVWKVNNYIAVEEAA